jgi:hypothetical protein
MKKSKSSTVNLMILFAAAVLVFQPQTAYTATLTHTASDFQNGDSFMVTIKNDRLELELGPVLNWTATGEAANDYFGTSAASAGDVNGDGYDDVIVGANRNDDGGLGAGKAYLYLGSSSGISASASWTATGEAAGDYFGYSVASAGDVNGDGYDDVIVSAHLNDDGGLYAVRPTYF